MSRGELSVMNIGRDLPPIPEGRYCVKVSKDSVANALLTGVDYYYSYQRPTGSYYLQGTTSMGSNITNDRYNIYLARYI